jgi:hypothetical protein
MNHERAAARVLRPVFVSVVSVETLGGGRVDGRSRPAP